MHCQSENEFYYRKMFNFFAICYPNLASSDNLTISTDGDKGVRPAIVDVLPNSLHVRCHYHLSRNISTSEIDPAVLQFKKTAYAFTEASFEEELEKLKKYPKAYKVVEKLDKSEWAYHAVSKTVHGRLSSQVAEVINSMLSSTGIRLSSPLVMIQKLSHWSRLRATQNRDRSESLKQEGELCTEAASSRLKEIMDRSPGLHMREENMILATTKVSATVSFPSRSSNDKFNVVLSLPSQDICMYSCTCMSKTETACAHVIGLLHRLQHQRGLNLPDLKRLVHPDMSAQRYKDQYSNAEVELADFSDLEKIELLPGPVLQRSGRPRRRRLVKKGTTNSCGHCGFEGHNKILCPSLSRVCSICEVKGHNRRTCTTVLNAHHRHALSLEQLAAIEQRRLERSLPTVQNNGEQQQGVSIRQGPSLTPGDDSN